MTQPFGVRLDAATLARLDAYAARIDHKRGGAAVRAIVAGLDVLEGRPDPGPASRVPASPSAGLDVGALAGALYDLIGPQIVDAVAEGAHRARAPDRRTPPPTPRPGGQRRAPVSDPPERRASDRLTVADVGRWVAEADNGRFKAHKLIRFGGGGTAECACGDSVDLRFARAAVEGRRRCAKCEEAAG